MRRLLTTAACCGALFAGSTVDAQDIVGKSLSRAGDAVSNTAGQARGVAQNLGNAVRNQVGHTGSGPNATVHRIGDAVLPHADPHSQHAVDSQHGVGVHANAQTSQGYGHQVHGGQTHGSYGNHTGVYYGHPGHAHGQRTLRGHHSSGHHAAAPQYGYAHQSRGIGGYNNQGYARQGYNSQEYGYSTSAMPNNAVYTLQHDSSGREFICVNGQPVYFDSVTSQPNAHQDNAQQDDRYQAGYGSYEGTADPHSPDDQNEHLEAPATEGAPQQDAEQASLEQTEANRAADNVEDAVDEPEAAADAENQDSDDALDSAPL